MAPAGRPGYAGRDNSVARAATRRPAGGGAVLAGAVGLAPLPLIRPPRRYGARCVDWRARPACLGTIPARAGEPHVRHGEARRPVDYPRAGGGTSASESIDSCTAGLSPRGRGNRRPWHSPGSGAGTIPARAGEPRSARRWSWNRWDYPRAGGGTDQELAERSLHEGLSPRGRGNRAVTGFRERLEGTIPARAGEPPRRAETLSPDRDYPRAGGGTTDDAAATYRDGGLSPRGRGNQLLVDRGELHFGTIPARAGEPTCPERGTPRRWDYPRAGGGTAGASSREIVSGGLSPRGRGNRPRALRPTDHMGTIPARAGEPRSRAARRSTSWDYPRAGGGTARTIHVALNGRGLSPRGRGNQILLCGSALPLRTIPARAGEPVSVSPAYRVAWDYPRAGGGTFVPAHREEALGGLSPRGRGNLRQDGAAPRRSGTIPARAGEPPSP